MLTNSDYLQIILQEPEITFFYHDRPILYTKHHNEKPYMIFLVEEDSQSDRFLAVEYTEPTYVLLNGGHITLREFVIHPNHTVHNVRIEYPQNDEPRVLLGEPFEDNNTIPDADLPSKDATWNSNFWNSYQLKTVPHVS